MDDKEFVKNILDGNQSCWKAFVERYTDWVLYTAWKFEQKFCRMPNKFGNCSLMLLLRQRKGEKIIPRKDEESCDEGMELYIWLIQQLRRRLKAYKGKSKLSTYIWVILNSNSLRVDILRWKYGRADECNDKRLPVVIQKLPNIERRIFEWLRRGKDEEFIIHKLGIEQELFRQSAQHVREVLLRAGLIDLIERSVFTEVDLSDPENEKNLMLRWQFQEQENKITSHLFCQQLMELLSSTVSRLSPAEQKLIKLYYQEGLSGKEISQFCSDFAASFEIEGKKINSQNVYYLLGKVTERLIDVLKLNIKGQQLSREQWLRLLNIVGQEGLWQKV
jgi:hypothetical protein